MSPSTFHQKTLFDQAIEPAERRAGLKAKPRRFFLQMHDATRLHYDLRLEHAGVLKSWALPKGPCLDPVVRRLAVLLKNHAVPSGTNEGTIPAGYGAGTVLLWDCGFWLPDQDVDQALRDGQLTFQLHGKKLKGIWSLTRMKPRYDERQVNWILKKEPDDEARSLSETDILVARPESVRSGRTLAEIAQEPPVMPLKPGTKRARKPAPNQLPLLAEDAEE